MTRKLLILTIFIFQFNSCFSQIVDTSFTTVAGQNWEAKYKLKENTNLPSAVIVFFNFKLSGKSVPAKIVANAKYLQLKTYFNIQKRGYIILSTTYLDSSKHEIAKSSGILKQNNSEGLYFNILPHTIPDTVAESILKVIPKSNRNIKNTKILDTNRIKIKSSKLEHIKLADSTNIIKSDKPSQKDLQVFRQYNHNQEVKINDNIYSDGKLFCIQISSWRSENKANTEAKILKDWGMKAYVEKVNISKTLGVWYRVRIGYFNSLNETENFLNKNKNILTEDNH